MAYIDMGSLEYLNPRTLAAYEGMSGLDGIFSKSKKKRRKRGMMAAAQAAQASQANVERLRPRADEALNRAQAALDQARGIVDQTRGIAEQSQDPNVFNAITRLDPAADALSDAESALQTLRDQLYSAPSEPERAQEAEGILNQVIEGAKKVVATAGRVAAQAKSVSVGVQAAAQRAAAQAAAAQAREQSVLAAEQRKVQFEAQLEQQRQAMELQRMQAEQQAQLALAQAQAAALAPPPMPAQAPAPVQAYQQAPTMYAPPGSAAANVQYAELPPGYLPQSQSQYFAPSTAPAYLPPGWTGEEAAAMQQVAQSGRQPDAPLPTFMPGPELFGLAGLGADVAEAVSSGRSYDPAGGPGMGVAAPESRGMIASKMGPAGPAGPRTRLGRATKRLADTVSPLIPGAGPRPEPEAPSGGGILDAIMSPLGLVAIAAGGAWLLMRKKGR